MRVFVSINWNTEILDILQDLQRSLQDAGVKGYWRDKNNLHLTLKFLGEITPDKISGIDKALKSIQERSRPFELNIGKLGVFPNLNQPRILWAGVQSQELLNLQRKIESELAKVGYPPESRSFRPHITLASGGITGFNSAIALGSKTVSQQVKEIELMESLVDRGKRKYVSIGSYLLH